MLPRRWRAFYIINKTHNVLPWWLISCTHDVRAYQLLIGASAGSLLPKAGRWMTVVRNLLRVDVDDGGLRPTVLPNAVTQPVSTNSLASEH
jgi:hypothetical protein